MSVAGAVAPWAAGRNAAHHAGEEVAATLDGDEREQQDTDEDEVVLGAGMAWSFPAECMIG